MSNRYGTNYSNNNHNNNSYNGGSEPYYTDSQIQYYHSHYLRNAKAIAILWVIFTICFGICNIVAFVEPHWIGRADGGGFGNFGLIQYCVPVLAGGGQDFQLRCFGSLADFNTILNPAFRAATVFIGLSFIAILCSLAAMILFFWLHPRIVFLICGCIQAFSALCMFLGVVIYPAGWDHDQVRQICGTTSVDYYAGGCSIRWAMILAILGIFDAIVLASLAFALARFYITSAELGLKQDKGYRGDFNGGYLSSGPGYGDGVSVISKKSMGLQPVMVPPPGVMNNPVEYDRYSHFSRPRTPAAVRARDYNL